MKLRNWLPTKYLTEENPFIGMSFEVGYGRIAVMVGKTIIHTMSNMVRADHDSQIFHCSPAYLYRKMGGLERDEFVHVHSNNPRGFLQYTGKDTYDSTEKFYAQALSSRRDFKAANLHPKLADIERMHRFINSPYLYFNVGTIGHVDHGRTFPGYATHALYEKQAREDARAAGFGELDYMQRKLLNNSRNGMGHPQSGHSSLTQACLTSKYKMTDMHGGMRVLVGLTNYLRDAQFRKIEASLAEKYYFTGDGMLPKDL